MMKTIIQRDFLDHVRSLQFMGLITLTVILFAANAFVFVKAYTEKTEEYRSQMAMRGKATSTRITGVLRHPNPMTFIAEGGESERPTGYMIQPGGNLMPEMPNPRTFKLPAVPPLDWSLIIRVLFSLYAVLLGFQSVSGEKEQGTLRLVFSNHVGRIRFLTAKYLSILFTLSLSLGIGLLVNLIVVGIYIPQILTAGAFSRIILVIVLSLAYISVFVLLSLLASSLISRSSLVLLSLLAAWILFTIIIPGSSIVLAEKLSSAAGEIQTAKMFEPMVQQEIWDRINGIVARAEKGEFRSVAEVQEEADQAFEEGQTKVNKFYEDFDRNHGERVRTARNVSRLSPAALFQFAAEDIVWTGDGAGKDFLRQVKEYSRIYDQYILRKLGKVVQTSRFSFSTSFDFQGKRAQLRSPRPQEYTGDKSDFPQFAERSPSLGGSLRSALFDLAGLIVWNIILAGLAFLAFLRADVR